MAIRVEIIKLRKNPNHRAGDPIGILFTRSPFSIDINVQNNDDIEYLLAIVRFHEGLCQGGHSTTVLDSIGGCDNPIITDPGNSDENRQDDNGDDEDDDSDDNDVDQSTDR